MYLVKKFGIFVIIVLFILFFNYCDRKLTDASSNKSNAIQNGSLLLND